MRHITINIKGFMCVCVCVCVRVCVCVWCECVYVSLSVSLSVYLLKFSKHQDAVSLKLCGGKLAPKLVYFALKTGAPKAQCNGILTCEIQ